MKVIESEMINQQEAFKERLRKRKLDKFQKQLN